jgi:hypothetical protein
MGNTDQKIIGVRVLDIAEEGAKTIEAMFNKVVKEINQNNTPIIDVQVTDNHCFILLGDKNRDSEKKESLCE